MMFKEQEYNSWLEKKTGVRNEARGGNWQEAIYAMVESAFHKREDLEG